MCTLKWYVDISYEINQFENQLFTTIEVKISNAVKSVPIKTW